MRFFADSPETAGLPFWQRPLGPLGIVACIAVVLGQVWLIFRLALGPFSSAEPDWIALGVPLALVGVGLIVGSLIGERRAKKGDQP
jgi:hypothetical protein